MSEHTYGTSFNEPQRQKDRQAEITRCLRDIYSKNPHIRRQAAKRLGELRAEAEALLALMDDGNSFVRSAAAEALGTAGVELREETIERLLAAIDDANDYVCTAAISSLGVLRADRARDQILECLSDENPFVVQAAIIALARIGPREIAPRLAEFLDSSNYLIQLAATRAVGLLDYRDAAPRVLENLQANIQQRNERDIKLPKNYIQTLARLKYRAAIPVLMEIANHTVGLRSVAVEALIDLNAEEAAPVLAPLLTDPSNNLRRNLIQMMIESDYRAALPLIRTLLTDPAITIREEALAAVNHWQDLASLDQVRWMCYHDPNPFVRPQAIHTLVSLSGRDALPSLVELAGDRNAYVRQAVAVNLGRLGPLSPEAIIVLRRMAGDEAVSEIARTVLDAQGLAPEAVERPLAMPSDRRPPVPTELLLGAPRLLETLQEWQAALASQIGHSAPEEIVALDQALSTLIAVLKDALRAA